MGFAMYVVQLLDTVQKYLNSNNIKTQFTNNRPGKSLVLCISTPS